MKIDKVLHIVVVLVMAIIMVASSAQADEPVYPQSHRLIVELETPPLVALESEVRGHLDVRSVTARSYIARLRQEQDSFTRSMRQVFPNATVSYYINENGEAIPATYQVVFNGLSIDLGEEPRLRNDLRQTRQALSELPGVKQVYQEQTYQPSLYTSTALINAPLVWNSVGGQSKAGAGVKIASIDAGLHKDAPMFNGTGYSYPAGFPAKGLGSTENNNGKIIASRAYFRSWDLPADGENNAWPGPKSSAHGNFTAGIAAGGMVDATYQGLSFPKMSGVAPKAWLMSYRVDYASANNPDGIYYTTETMAALEDAVKDGADVINNSWEFVLPTEGGENDPLDKALVNASKAGVFVAQAAGNRGPNKGTLSAPSPDIMTVANSTTTGNISAGSFGVSAPQPVPSNLMGIAYTAADFGPQISEGATLNYNFVTAEGIDPANFEGCKSWQPDVLKGMAVIIRRGQTQGACLLATKVINAEKAGAVFVVVYNNLLDSEEGGGAFRMGDSQNLAINVKISAISIKNSDGVRIVDWYAKNGNASKILLTSGYTQVGNTPDRIAKDSGRGPGVGNVLKPDMAAPGVNILSQGDLNGQDMTKHLVYGQGSGTSFATPHVAGAAALLQQIHPDWSNADIKSALMSTAKYLEMYNYDETAAQPLDMGAGRLDLTHAADPGVILNPPSLSYGLVTQGMTQSIQVQLKSVADKAETYAITTLYTGGGFTATTTLSGFTVSPKSVTVEAGGTAVITITFDSAASKGMGDNQGYVILKGTNHEAHLPAWARVTRADKQADILLLDNDGSGAVSPPTGVKDYQKYYTDALTKIGSSYQVWDIDTQPKSALIPDITTLMSYKTVIYFTGNNRTPLLSEQDMNLLAEYLNSGGAMIAMGQNLAAMLNSNTTDEADLFYSVSLGANFLQESVSSNQSPTRLITATQQAPLAFQNITIDVFAGGDGASQTSIDEFTGQPSLLDAGDPNLPMETEQYVSLFGYPGDNHKQYKWVYTGKEQFIDGVVGTSNRMLPSLERPQIYYRGRSIYTGFGLEGVNNSDSDLIKREELLKTFLNWAWDEPQVTLASVGTGESNLAIMLEAKFSSPITGTTDVSYRWDFGDGTPIQTQKADGKGKMQINHTYASCGLYPVRVEVTDFYGNRAVNSFNVTLGNCQAMGSAGGVITFTHAVSSAISLNIPPNSGIEDNSSLVYEPITSTHITATKGLSFTGITFTLELLRNGKPVPVVEFTSPITTTIYYSDSEIAGLDESTLVLRYWRAKYNEWSDYGITNVITPSNHRLIVRLTHFSEFAMFGQKPITVISKTVYLPVLVKE